MKSWPSVLVGVVIGAVVGNVGGTVASVAVNTQRRLEVRRGWSSTPVLIATRDLAAGALLTPDDVKPSAVAEKLAPLNHVKLEASTSVMSQRLRVPLKAGQPLEWSFIDVVMLEQAPAYEACRAAVAAKQGVAR